MAGKFRRYHNRSWLNRLTDWRTLVLNIYDGFRFLVGVLRSIYLLLRIRPDCIFIKGGFVGLPVGVAAWILRRPFMTHESDSVPGLTNKILGRLTPHRVSGFDIEGYENLGNPVRPEITLPSSYSLEDFGINSDKPIILAFGGSLGSVSLNDVVVSFARSNSDYEIIHITGDGASETDDSTTNYHAYKFLSDKMPAALQMASVVVSRAGANTLAELATLGKVSIIVPHPSLSGNHQYKNAAVMADSGAVVLIDQNELTLERFASEVERVSRDEDLRNRLSENIAKFARQDSAELIADKLLSIARKKRRGVQE